ncbi:MAG: aminoacyl-histidine dipeptidase, partial [Bacteroidales bacterium]|nr:aminoacyl-histidine dipeptidase [Bacteroidales bacterium]
IDYLKKFAERRSLRYRTDKAGNVVIIKDATPGMEDLPVVVLQSHSDMVCEKTSNSDHNFATDPIKFVEEDGWLIAKETTLGADCGIGMAAQLAILDASDIPHGPLEALFTTEEETGLTGAKSLKPGFITGNILINLDSEDEGELFIGCAGGIDTTATFKHKEEQVSGDYTFIKAGFYGSTGGHSGDDIDKGRANANQLLARFLYKIHNRKNFILCEIDGGNKRNAIARDAYAIFGIAHDSLEEIRECFNRVASEIKEEYRVSDPGLDGIFQVTEKCKSHIDTKIAIKLIRVLNGIPHGVLAMSQDIPGFVETSTNLAAVKMVSSGNITVTTSQRSSLNSARHYAAERIESALILAGASVTHESEYPGWKPDPTSKLLSICRESYKRIFSKDPVVRAIHAGLECGLFLDIYPGLDMISFGPTVKGAHAPGERLEIASVEKFWKLLTDVLYNIKDYSK